MSRRTIDMIVAIVAATVWGANLVWLPREWLALGFFPGFVLGHFIARLGLVDYSERRP